MGAPLFLDHPAYRALRVDDLDAYHMAVINHTSVDFTGADLRGIDLRKADLSKLILRDAYFRDGDLRGCDLRHLDLEGASFHNTKVAGAYFPSNVSPAELQMSIEYGTRIRTTSEGP